MKKKDSVYIIIIQNLFIPIWLRQLSKALDYHYLILQIHPFKDTHNYINLTIVFVFPYLPFRPWQLMSIPKMLTMGRNMCKMFKTQEVDTRDISQNILLANDELSFLSQNMVLTFLY